MAAAPQAGGLPDDHHGDTTTIITEILCGPATGTEQTKNCCMTDVVQQNNKSPRTIDLSKAQLLTNERFTRRRLPRRHCRRRSGSNQARLAARDGDGPHLRRGGQCRSRRAAATGRPSPANHETETTQASRHEKAATQSHGPGGPVGAGVRALPQAARRAEGSLEWVWCILEIRGSVASGGSARQPQAGQYTLRPPPGGRRPAALARRPTDYLFGALGPGGGRGGRAAAAGLGDEEDGEEELVDGADAKDNEHVPAQGVGRLEDGEGLAQRREHL